jgi:hypothetical protein
VSGCFKLGLSKLNIIPSTSVSVLNSFGNAGALTIVRSVYKVESSLSNPCILIFFISSLVSYDRALSIIDEFVISS